MAELTDESLMPNGQHKGKEMINVPADYLIWLYDNDRCNPQVRTYIEGNGDVLRQEKKEIDSKKLRSWR